MDSGSTLLTQTGGIKCRSYIHEISGCATIFPHIRWGLLKPSEVERRYESASRGQFGIIINNSGILLGHVASDDKARKA